MTPLVDVAFLLLTFFMFTTSMSRPQTMEINLPPDKTVTIETMESKLLNIRVNDKGDIFWAMALNAPKKVEFKDLRAFLKDKVNTISGLVVVLKIDRAGKFNMMVNIIDEFNGTGVSRFSIAPITDQDKALMARAM